MYWLFVKVAFPQLSLYIKYLSVEKHFAIYISKEMAYY